MSAAGENLKRNNNFVMHGFFCLLHLSILGLHNYSGQYTIIGLVFTIIKLHMQENLLLIVYEYVIVTGLQLSKCLLWRRLCKEI